MLLAIRPSLQPYSAGRLWPLSSFKAQPRWSLGQTTFLVPDVSYSTVCLDRPRLLLVFARRSFRRSNPKGPAPLESLPKEPGQKLWLLCSPVPLFPLPNTQTQAGAAPQCVSLGSPSCAGVRAPASADAPGSHPEPPEPVPEPQ